MSRYEITPPPANPSGTGSTPPKGMLHRTPIEMCGRAAGPLVTTNPANENDPRAESLLFNQLPTVIRDAVDEWAQFLTAKPWRVRRELMTTFSRIFADQFREHAPNLTDEDYEGMKEIGFTCLLERIDARDEMITDIHQARIYLDSVHEEHRMRAQVFLQLHRPRDLEIAATGGRMN